MTRRSVPPIVLVPLLIVAIVVSSSACGTMANFNGGVVLIGLPDPNRPPLPYGGVLWEAEKAVKSDRSVGEKVLIFPLWLVDVGLCVGLDTVTLPLVAWFHAKRVYQRATGTEPEKATISSPVPTTEDEFGIVIVSPTAMERILNPKN
ncbi:MAG: hypothetical protein EXS09_02890 [Gemmataceae bacterium]|nr:hypothetical protein [Gemmataceae bacterium]